MLALVLASCGGESETASEPTPAPEGPKVGGKVGPAPKTKVEYARKAFELLAKDDWDAYTDLLATRADVLGLAPDTERELRKKKGRRKNRRKRRRLRKQINSLRSEDGQRGWDRVRRAVRDRGIAWEALKIRDIKDSPSGHYNVPTLASASRLVIELEHGERIFRIDLATVVETKRGWVAVEAMEWHDGAETSELADSLLRPQGDPPLATGP